MPWQEWVTGVTHIFQLTQEDTNKLVSGDVLGVSLSHKDIGLIKEDYSIPFCCKAKQLFHVCREGGGIDAEILSLEIEKRTVSAVGD